MSDAIDRFIKQYRKEKEARFRSICDYIHNTESPIERMLAAAVCCLGDLREIDVKMGSSVAAVEAYDHGDIERLWFVPQVGIENYRVDFIAMATCQFSKGWHKLVVECDGHDYHERTKEQAARDRKRDRFMQERGYKVYRFTGAEIHRDLYGCADQVISWAWACFTDDFEATDGGAP